MLVCVYVSGSCVSWLYAMPRGPLDWFTKGKGNRRKTRCIYNIYTCVYMYTGVCALTPNEWTNERMKERTNDGKSLSDWHVWNAPASYSLRARRGHLDLLWLCVSLGLRWLVTLVLCLLPSKPRQGETLRARESTGGFWHIQLESAWRDLGLPTNP